MSNNPFLSFGNGNAKLPRSTGTFSLPSGHTCPGASQCLAKADRQTGTITDGPKQQHRCFSASQEAIFPSVRKSRWRNMELLRKQDGRAGMAQLIEASVRYYGFLQHRVHVGGDFFSSEYFGAWMDAALKLPDRTFYAYTKSINFWTERLDQGEGIPSNFTLIASYGSRHDHLIRSHDLPSAMVVDHPDVAVVMGLEIDHDDSLAASGTQAFALLLHGTQARGSAAAEAAKRMKAEGVEFGYGRSNPRLTAAMASAMGGLQ